MKFLTAIATILLFASCSSASKNTNTTTNTAKETTQTSTTVAAKTDTKMDAAHKAQCRLNEDQRTIALMPKGDGCEVIYTKMGQAKMIASDAKGTKHCDDVVTKIEKHLTDAGYTCN